MIERSTTAITRISTIRRPIDNQVDQFCSTQSAALVADCCAPSRVSADPVRALLPAAADQVTAVTGRTSRSGVDLPH